MVDPCGYGITFLIAKRLHLFEQLYIVGQHEKHLVMYSLDLCVSYFAYLAIFMTHEGSREALNFL